MKLNLLPTTEKKSRQGKTAYVAGALIVLTAIGASLAITLIASGRLNAAKAAIGDLPSRVANADATSKKADTIIATAAPVIRNAQLAQAMIDHNDVYAKLYDDVKRYIPPYYRIQSMTAAPIGEGTSQLTLVGTLAGYQRYADVMLALMRFKDAVTISRAGYNLNDPTVPALETDDQSGKMRLADQPPIPDDGLERLAYFQTQAAAAPQGYLQTGNFGSGTSDVRGPLPDASVVTIVMTVARDLRVPLAADTLRAGGTGAAGGAGALGGGATVPGGIPGRGAGPAGPGEQ